jgi:hypothetical protein
MRIVVWNCKMALSRKRQHLYDLHPRYRRHPRMLPELS